jgi:magnesium chelatase family protein
MVFAKCKTMKLKSLIQNANRLDVAEVEIEFIPGIPQIHFLGLPDRIIKESFYRIKSALKSSGYKFPLTSQMIVNIKPNHLRKSSRGVELAVALGILLKTEQISEYLINKDWVIYGELGLDGSIYEPSDLSQNLYALEGLEILTGHVNSKPEGMPMELIRLSSLKNLELSKEKSEKNFIRPQEGLNKKYSEQEAEFIFLAAISGLHALLAGDSGAGKSTLARALVSFLSEPVEGEYVRVEKNWRPVVAPHQSITPGAFLGGGTNLFEGEVERVQGGILLLDELLEFDPFILESLRGPMTGDILRLSRGSFHREISSQFQVLATTNLCPCGKWSPLKTNMTCRFSRLKCTRYLDRFSGPILDRFALLMFSTHAERKISGQHILNRIQNMAEIYKQYRHQIVKVEASELLASYYGHLSPRRKSYLEQIAKIYALEEHSTETDRNAKSSAESCSKKQLKVQMKHLSLSEKWVVKPFEQLEKGMD